LESFVLEGKKSCLIGGGPGGLFLSSISSFRELRSNERLILFVEGLMLLLSMLSFVADDEAETELFSIDMISIDKIERNALNLNQNFKNVLSPNKNY